MSILRFAVVVKDADQVAVIAALGIIHDRLDFFRGPAFTFGLPRECAKQREGVAVNGAEVKVDRFYSWHVRSPLRFQVGRATCPASHVSNGFGISLRRMSA